MTLVVLHKQGDDLMCFSDTRISNTISGNPMSETGAKLLSFTAKYSFLNQNHRKKGFIQKNFDVGFAFAGSTLIANTVFSIASNCCRNLSTSKSSKHVSIEAIAEVFRFSFQAVWLDICSRHGKPSASECVVFGYCPHQRKIRSFGITVTENSDNGAGNGFEFWKKEVPEGHPGLAIGSGNKEFNKRFEIAFKHAKMTDTKVYLGHLFAEIVDDSSVKDVGGYVQFCRASKTGIAIPLLIKRSTDPKKVNFMMYGVDFDLIGDLGGGYTINDQSPGAEFMGFH